MRNALIVSIIFLAATVGHAQSPAPAQQNQLGGSIDHTGAIGSVAPPPGWKTCPRCQNRQDRIDAIACDLTDGRGYTDPTMGDSSS